jgi:predicted permease
MERRLPLVDLLNDVRVSLRGLRRAPVMAVTIVAAVGLGIGATTAIFAAVHAALLRPLPYADPGRLVRIFTDAPPNRFRLSAVDYLALEAQQTQFARIAAYTDRTMAVSDGVVAERLRGREVTWTYFGVLGVVPVLGRDFTVADGRPGGPPAVIVSHGFWQRRLGGRPDAAAATVRLDGRDHAVVGVLPTVTGPLEQGQELFVVAQWEAPRRKGPFLYTVLARLKPGAVRASAAEELRAINRRLFPLWRASYQDEKATWSMVDLKTHVVGDVRTTAGLALTAVALVWLIACANASNLLIARVTSRRRELAVRASLGASRGRVVRHLLAESALLAAGAAAVGIALAWTGTRLLRELAAGYFPRTPEITLDGPVLLLLGALTVASVPLFGLAPALQGAGTPLRHAETLLSAGRSSSGGRAVRRLRRSLVGGQFAIATPLLVVAALLLTSLGELGAVDLGFDSRRLVTGSISLPVTQYPEPGTVAAFWDELERRVTALPGVSAVAFADGRPPNEVGNFNNFDLEDAPTPPGRSQPVAPWIQVTPSYLRLLGLALLEGRFLDQRDGLPPDIEAVVVDRAWAKRFFPGASAVGRRFREGGCTTCPWTTVVGVVSDVKYAGLSRGDEGAVYWPMTPATRTRYLLVRTAVDPVTVLPAMRRVVQELDPSLPLSAVATIDDLVTRSLQRPRSLSILVGSLAGVALLLSVVGIYGVMAYHVQQHSKEIGIRLALGGGPGDVLRWAMGEGLRVVAGGVVVGALASLALTRLVSSLLFGVGAGDPATFIAVALLMLAAGLVACAIPARRAVRLAPASVLRDE